MKNVANTTFKLKILVFRERADIDLKDFSADTADIDVENSFFTRTSSSPDRRTVTPDTTTTATTTTTSQAEELEKEEDEEIDMKCSNGFITQNGITVELVGHELWKKFHKLGTEMIITKAGR